VTITQGTELNISTIRSSWAKHSSASTNEVELYIFSPTGSHPSEHKGKWEWIQHPHGDKLTAADLTHYNMLFELKDGEKLEIGSDKNLYWDPRVRRRVDALVVIVKKPLYG